MNEEFNIKEDKTEKNSYKAALDNLSGLDSMFSGFMETEGVGMIICETCLDNVYEDDEDVCIDFDTKGYLHTFCCKECLDRWKKGL